MKSEWFPCIQLETARKQWREADWRLSFLRTLSAQPLPQPKDEEIIKWHSQTSYPVTQLKF